MAKELTGEHVKIHAILHDMIVTMERAKATLNL